MATAQVTIEGHPLASRAGLWCPKAGGHFGRVEVDVAIVALQDSGVERLAVVTGSECLSCGVTSEVRC